MSVLSKYSESSAVKTIESEKISSTESGLTTEGSKTVKRRYG